MAQLWDRLDHETDKAFAAFLAYRNLGPARTVRDAYRQVTGKPKASQAPGYFSKWAKDFRWDQRAAAFDDRQAQRQERGQAVGAFNAGLRWEEERHRAAAEAVEAGRKLLARARLLADFPIASRQVSPDGLTVVDPIEPKELRTAAYVAAKGFGIIQAAVDWAMPPAADDGFDLENCTDPDEIRRYIAQLEGRAG